MKKLTYLLFMLFLITALISNCKKKLPPEPTLLEQLPKRTENGEERLVGIVNNEYIFSNNGIPWINPEYGLHSWCTAEYVGLLHIKGTYYNNDGHSEDLFIEVSNIFGVGNYNIDDTTTIGITSTAYYFKRGIYYNIDSNHVGELIVTKFDTVNNIYSGTFNLNLINDETQQTITITNGWFDITD